MKTCCQCRTEKPLAEFSKDKSRKDGLQLRCKACVAIYRAENLDRIKESQAAYHAANRKELTAAMRARYAANPEPGKARSAAWYAANPEKAKASADARRAADPEKANARRAEWVAQNPEKRRATSRISSHNRRALKLVSGEKLSAGLAEKLFKLQRGKCACGCGQPLGDDYHLDHNMPLALGGEHADDNIQLLRKTCNLHKSAKHPVDFMQQRGFLL